MPEHLRQTTLIDFFRRSLKTFYSGRYRVQRIRDSLFNGLYKFTYFTYLLTYLLTYCSILQSSQFPTSELNASVRLLTTLYRTISKLL